MTETQFNQLVDTTLQEIEEALDACGVDLDFETAAGILEIACNDGSKIVVNRQTPNREIWVAARAGGFHFRHRDDGWYDTRDGTELFARLSNCLSAQAGTSVTLKHRGSG